MAIEENIKKDRIAQVLENIYLVFFVLFVSYSFLNTTMFEINWPKYFYKDLRMILVIVIFLRAGYACNYSKKDILLVGIIGVIFLIDFNRSGANIIYDLLLMILGAKGISFRKLLGIYLFVTAGLLLFTNIAALLGKVENLKYYYDTRRRRVAMGIIYPTDFAAHVFFCIAAYVYFRSEKIKYIELIGLALIGLLTYWLTDARTDAACIFLLVAFLLYYKIRQHLAVKKNKTYKMNPVFSLLLALSPVLCAGFMTVTTAFYSKESQLLVFLDKLINKRLSLGNKAFETFGFSLWGQSIPSAGNGETIETQTHYFYLDSSYIRTLMMYGLVIFIVILLIWTFITFDARYKKQEILLIVLTVVSIQCMIEHHMLEVAYNPFLWCLLADFGQEWPSKDWKDRMRLRKKVSHEK